MGQNFFNPLAQSLIKYCLRESILKWVLTSVDGSVKEPWPLQMELFVLVNITDSVLDLFLTVTTLGPQSLLMNLVQRTMKLMVKLS